LLGSRRRTSWKFAAMAPTPTLSLGILT
jgi:energy-converting hydrogenase Eha subunit A